MTALNLAGRRILVVEDEYFIAVEIETILREQGAVVIGPVSTLDEAESALQGGSRIDLVVLDINLHGEMAFSIAAALEARHVPVLLATGYDIALIPPEFRHVPRLEKPFTPQMLVRAVPDAFRGL